jgi:hypothetical protein
LIASSDVDLTLHIVIGEQVCIDTVRVRCMCALVGVVMRGCEVAMDDTTE